MTSFSESQQLNHSTTASSCLSPDITRFVYTVTPIHCNVLFKQNIAFICISDIVVHENLVDYLIFLSNTSFSSILENAQFGITKLAHVLNANTP